MIGGHETVLRGARGTGQLSIPAKTKDEQIACRASWLLHIPGPHEWQHYLVSLINSLSRSKKWSANVTHAMTVYAVSSEAGPPDPEDVRALTLLTPVNYDIQFGCPSDARAIQLSRQFAQALLDGDFPEEPGPVRAGEASRIVTEWIARQLHGPQVGHVVTKGGISYVTR